MVELYFAEIIEKMISKININKKKCNLVFKYTLLGVLYINFILSVSVAKDFIKNIEINSSVRGLNLANAYGTINISKNKYDIQIKAKTVGVFSIFSDWKQSIVSSGDFNSFKLVSSEYFSRDKRANKEGHIKIDFSNTIPQLLSAQPDPRKDNRREKIDKNILKKVVDPIAGIINLGLKDECQSKSDVFDGKRRYAIKTNKIDTEILEENNFFENKIESIKCSFKIIKIAGYTKKEKKKFPKEGIIWLAKFKGEDLYFPVKLKIESSWGNFICLIKERIS